jgi:hypothetical protein
MNNTKFRYSVYIISIVLTANSFFLTGCSEYKTFTIYEGIAHFSFQYPSYYEIARIGVGTNTITDVILGSPAPEEYKDVTGGHPQEEDDLPSIFIQVRESSDTWPSAEQCLEKDLRTLQNTFDVFDIRSQKKITLFDIQADQITYLCKDNDWPYSEVRTEVYFDYGELVWIISIFSPERFSQDYVSVFNHILKTFRIINDKDPVGDIKQFKWVAGATHFYFKYPNDYILLGASEYDYSWTHSSVTLTQPLLEGEAYGDRTVIHIKARDMNDPRLDYPDYSKYIDNIVARNNLTERKSIIIAGVPGEEVAYNSTWNRRTEPDDNTVIEKIPKVTREVYFNHNGNLWNIMMMSSIETAEIDKDTLYQIINSFTIIN